MATPSLTRTTLSAAITASQTRFAVASSSGINGLGSTTTPPSKLVVDGECMLVQSVPLSGVVEVMRGVDGTEARAHASGAGVLHGAQTSFRNFDGKLGLYGSGGTPDGSLPPYGLPGDEEIYGGKTYVMVAFLATVHTGVVVGISNDGAYTAVPLVVGHQGAVGVCAEQTTPTGTSGWVQVTGSANAMNAQADTSGATSAYIPIIAASVASPDAGVMAIIGTTSTPQLLIYNMFIVGAATTNVTNGGTAGSHTGVGLPCFLNRPYVMLAATDVGLS